ncbi:hypothetical protein [Methylomonas sp. UP202]|uniref:hypothetical protein n=1 Tax=Methylomonas sp. UP202 TaxID=3040943 RepID=UPI00247A3EDA|nr:hypothetical protein [Methylomonas sp. UP202]WGS87728.1 hypothetical protein QC632_08200 [Methylomonas sp. UP202]
MRPEIQQLIDLGPLPPEAEASLGYLREAEGLLRAIEKPLSDEEARNLISLFGPPDSCYGFAWSLLHLIETAPSWPMADCLENPKNEWVSSLRDRAVRRGFL